ncbi:MAG TPA: SDR family NAD(P)-dependent oxidoreductase [Solirubrobacteraceae bacterium]|jgi:decaprenylphospho-beta-D-erythro-pentofuranosid-2-ulose 2-reductase
MSSVGSGSRGRHVILLGGSSEIGLAIVRELQMAAPREVALVGRSSAALDRAAEELRGAGCERVLTAELDALQVEAHGEVIRRTIAELGGADIVILAAGILGERGGLPADVAGAVEVMRVNFVGAGSLLINAAGALRERGGGTIVVLSSVAAERARRSNAVYGASKAGLDALAQGLADALHDEGVRVMVVRPGFVHTRMTAGLDAAPLSSTPQAVAGCVLDGLDRGADTVWAPRPLQALMLILRIVPRTLFRRIKQ